MPSAAEVTNDNISLGDMNDRLLRKIEELILRLITIEKNNEKLQKEVEAFKVKK